mgnify:CR=1 FL=1
MIHPAERLFRSLSADPLQRRNCFWTVVSSSLGVASATSVAGPVLQTFLVKVGLTEARIGLYGSVTALASAAGLLSLMGVAN